MIQSAFLSAVLVLQRDHDRFQWTQDPQRQDQRQRDPHHHMNPDCRSKGHFRNKRQADDNEPYEQYNEYSGSIAGINEFIIQVAG